MISYTQILCCYCPSYNLENIILPLLASFSVCNPDAVLLWHTYLHTYNTTYVHTAPA